MDEAGECDSLLLMRDGSLLAHLTPDELRERTGERDLGRAFLAVIEREGASESSGSGGGSMSARTTFATARRVLWQIRRDPRTVALLLAVPTGLLVLLYFLFEKQPHTFQRIGAPLCGLFPFIVMFLVTSIAMLRERTSGTLERLMTLPVAKADILFGYGIAFGVLASAPGARRVHGRLRAARASTQPTARGWSACLRSPTRSSGWRSGCSRAHSREPSSRPFSSCPR